MSSHDLGDEAADIRGWLAEVDVPPPRGDASELVALARTRTRHRRQLATGGTLAVVLIAVAAVPAAWQLWPSDASPAVVGELAATPGATPAATPAADPVECSARLLEPPDGLAARGVVDPAVVSVTAMDPTGRYVVGDTYRAGNDSPVTVRWEDGTPQIIPSDLGHVSAVAVNARGEVVGDSSAAPSQWYGWVFRDGQVSTLPIPAGFVRSEVAGINAAGDVVGTVQDADFHSEVVVWPAASPDQPRLLESPTDHLIAPAGIADDGTVVGWFHGSTGGYVWDAGGVGRELSLPDGADHGTIATVAGDWAVGYAEFPATEAAAASRFDPADLDELAGFLDDATVGLPVRWNLRTGAAELVPGYRDLGVLPLNAAGFGAQAVNELGDLVIGYPDPQVLRVAGERLILPSPVDGAVPDPVAIDRTGRLVAGMVVADTWRDPPELDAPLGSGTGPGEPSDLPRAVLWHC